MWFVAHPRQLREWKGQAPNLYDISGSAHFINKVGWVGLGGHSESTRNQEGTDVAAGRGFEAARRARLGGHYLDLRRLWRLQADTSSSCHFRRLG